MKLGAEGRRLLSRLHYRNPDLQGLTQTFF
jgi:hypothetical protein